MDRKKWKTKIKKACKDAGTYRPFFDAAIETLAALMETRDEAEAQYKSLGGKPVVEHTNSHGATNAVKNPALQMRMECDAQALAYWRDLGLTPSGYKKLNAEVVEKQSAGAFEDLLLRLVE